MGGEPGARPFDGARPDGRNRRTPARWYAPRRGRLTEPYRPFSLGAETGLRAHKSPSLWRRDRFRRLAATDVCAASDPGRPLPFSGPGKVMEAQLPIDRNNNKRISGPVASGLPRCARPYWSAARRDPPAHHSRNGPNEPIGDTDLPRNGRWTGRRF